MHYYKFNIADYRKDTTHLSMLEHGIYRTLIDWYYLDEKPISLDVDLVARRMRLSTEDEMKSLKLVLYDFFEKTEKGHKHKRINVDILGYHENSEKNKVNGKLGGRPRKTQPVTSGNPNESEAKGNHKPLTNNHKQKKNTVIKPDGLDPLIWDQFIEYRKTKKATVSQLILNSLIEEGKKINWSLEKVMTEMIVRNWQGFKGDWVKTNVQQFSGASQKTRKLTGAI